MNKLTKYSILIFAFLLNVFQANATTCESVATPSGDWDDNATWDCGAFPAPGVCYDTIIIGQNTYIDDHVDLTGCPPIVLIVNDSLTFKSGKKLHLPAGSTVIIHVGGALIPEGGGGNSNQLNIGGSVFWNAGDGVLAGTSVLDIELTEFYATQLDKAVQLLWTTRSEVNNDYFTIEKSKDASNFEKVGDVNGAGNSSNEINYSFLDNHTFSGISYYKLILMVHLPTLK